MLSILQFSTTLTASLYELQLISLTVTNPYPKSGFFDMCISESSDEGSLLSAEMCMISTSSLQKSMATHLTILLEYFPNFLQEVMTRCTCLNWPIKIKYS